MYTTLKHLKEASACRDGFSKLLSFFGTSASIKDKQIPLHAVLLISGKSDFNWAARHGCIIDPVQYVALLNRVLPGLIRYAREDEYDFRRAMRKSEATTFELGLIDQVGNIQTYDDLVACVKTLSFNRCGDTSMWSTVLPKLQEWLNPADMLEYLSEHHHKMQLEKSLSYYDTKQPADIRLAHVLVNGNPFDFLEDMPPKLGRGINLASKNKMHTLSLTNISSQKLFYLMRSLNLKDTEDVEGRAAIAVDQQQVLVNATEQWTVRSQRAEDETEDGMVDDDDAEDSDNPRPAIPFRQNGRASA